MSDAFTFNPAFNRPRWVGYFDLLGTRELIRSGNVLRVFEVYERAARELLQQKGDWSQIGHAWFSDTFLIYSATERGFAGVDNISRWFLLFLVLAEIPVRGAIALGDFYADPHNHVYFGKALVEAYETGEAQDWIGLALSPSAASSAPRVMSKYVTTEIPSKKRLPGPIPAAVLGRWGDAGHVLQKLRKMREHLIRGGQPESVVRKYDNTITFVERNR